MKQNKLTFKYGTMNSGKSLQLLATAYNFQERNIPFVVLKSSIDTRDEGVIHSRALGDRECITIKPEENVFEKLLSVFNYESWDDVNWKWILVDEAQFLTEEQVDQLSRIVDYANIDVVCYGLRTDFKTHLFPGSKRLFEIADKVEEIVSYCDCGEHNIVNARVDKDGNVLTNGKQIEVGGDDRYIAMCRKCYYERTENKMYRKRNEDES